MRIQLELPEEDVKELEDLKKESGLTTWKELFSNALTLLYWATKEKRAGRIIASLNEKDAKYKELCLPCLERIGRSNNNTDHNQASA